METVMSASSSKSSFISSTTSLEKSNSHSSQSIRRTSPPSGFSGLVPQSSRHNLSNKKISLDTALSNLSRKASSSHKLGVEKRETYNRRSPKPTAKFTADVSRVVLPTSKALINNAQSIPEVIKKKRNGERLFPDELMLFVKSILEGSIHQAQLGAMLMAIYLRGLNTDETVAMTKALIHNGSILSWPDEWRRLVVDKHSTGGVGDKISFILAPVLAVCGLKVPMISSAGTELSGSTLDKLQSIPGIRVNLVPLEIRAILQTVGCCISSEYSELLPADKIIYQTREITGTVDSPPLIIASIMSKKASEGLAALVLDVKYGRASIMKSKDEARNLAYAMVNIGYKMGIKTSALLSSMDSPVGNTIGNALEIAEALQCLKGQDRSELKELTMKLGGELLYLLSATTRKEGADIISKIIREGKALSKFKDMIIAQGVRSDIANKLCDPRADVWSILPRAPHVTSLASQFSGIVHYIDALELGRVAHNLGSGRTKPKDLVYSNVGLELQVQVGSSILKGQTWIRVHHIHNELDENYITHIQKSLVVRPTEFLGSPSRVTEIITQH